VLHFALRRLAESWVLWYVAFDIAANFFLPEVAYALLAIGAAVSIITKRLEPECGNSLRAAAAVLAIAASQTPLLLWAAPSRPSLLYCAFAVTVAVCEELFFRGVLLPDIGNLPQAFAFALAHMRLSDPVSLVESALLFPHYLLLGVALGLTAEACGYPASALAHAVYNLLSSVYTLPFDAWVVAVLLVCDSISISAVALVKKVEKHEHANHVVSRDKLRATVAALALALAASPLLAYVSGLWERYWVLATNLGDEPAYVALAVLLYTLVSPDLGFRVLLALAFSGWANVALKNMLKMPRPPRELWKVEASGYGFPSGHAQTSASFWSSLALETRDASTALLGAVVVALVSYSRVELGVHYPIDVIGGIAFGLLSALAALAYARSSRKTRAATQSFMLLLLGSFAASVYAIQADITLARTGGVIAGSAVYPLLERRIPQSPSARRRLLAAAAALAAAFLITRAASSAHPLLQFLAYAVAVAAAMSAPFACEAVCRRLRKNI